MQPPGLCSFSFSQTQSRFPSPSPSTTSPTLLLLPTCAASMDAAHAMCLLPCLQVRWVWPGDDGTVRPATPDPALTVSAGILIRRAPQLMLRRLRPINMPPVRWQWFAPLHRLALPSVTDVVVVPPGAVTDVVVVPPGAVTWRHGTGCVRSPFFLSFHLSLIGGAAVPARSESCAVLVLPVGRPSTWPTSAAGTMRPSLSSKRLKHRCGCSETDWVYS